MLPLSKVVLLEAFAVPAGVLPGLGDETLGLNGMLNLNPEMDPEPDKEHGEGNEDQVRVLIDPEPDSGGEDGLGRQVEQRLRMIGLSTLSDSTSRTTEGRLAISAASLSNRGEFFEPKEAIISSAGVLHALLRRQLLARCRVRPRSPCAGAADRRSRGPAGCHETVKLRRLRRPPCYQFAPGERRMLPFDSASRA